MQYFVQAFGARMPYPDKYDLLTDTATEELSHLDFGGRRSSRVSWHGACWKRRR